VKGHAPSVEVEHCHTSTDGPVAGLTHSAGIEQPTLLGSDAKGARDTVRGPPGPLAEGRRAMGVAEHERPCGGRSTGEASQLVACEPVGRHVAPGVVERSMGDHDLAQGGRERQHGQPRAAVRVQHRSRPVQRHAGQLADALRGEAVDRDQVMVAGDAASRQRREQLDALVRMRTVAHDVSGAHELVDSHPPQKLQA
jgi:hypothetical protein